uniref:P7 n=1 Tax=Heterorhabditis bacteriophora TaxID=37862 RepID=A0A1I7WPL3_HETBA
MSTRSHRKRAGTSPSTNDVSMVQGKKPNKNSEPEVVSLAYVCLIFFRIHIVLF